MDVVVTVPKTKWLEWKLEGDLPGEDWSGLDSHFFLGGKLPIIDVGERVYIIAFSKVRGYAPLVRIENTSNGGYALVRRGGAVAITIDTEIPGFRGFMYRFWALRDEKPFPDWRKT